MKTHEQIAIESDVCAGVLGRDEDFLLVRLDKEYSGKQESIECAIERGLFYCGTLGWSREGGMSFALEPDPETLKPLRLATLGFAVLVGRLAVPAESRPESHHGDSVDWLKRLGALPDTRTQA